MGNIFKCRPCLIKVAIQPEHWKEVQHLKRQQSHCSTGSVLREFSYMGMQDAIFETHLRHAKRENSFLLHIKGLIWSCPFCHPSSELLYFAITVTFFNTNTCVMVALNRKRSGEIRFFKSMACSHLLEWKPGWSRFMFHHFFS